MAGGESPRSALAVHAVPVRMSFNLMFFNLGYVMGNVIDKLQPGGLLAHAQNTAERLPHPVGDALAVGPGIIGSAAHGGKVCLPFRRFYGAAGKLAVRHFNTILLHSPYHLFDVIFCYLVSQSARTAVDIQHDLPQLIYSHFAGYVRFGNLIHHGYLQEMVA